MFKSKQPTALSRATVLTAAPETTVAGQLMRAIHGELLEQIGENATAAQRILIQMAAIKATRCHLWERKVLSDDADLPIDDQHRWLAWSNSTRADLMALGIKDTASRNTVDLSTYLQRKAAKTKSAA
jgi:hypothetical protein